MKLKKNKRRVTTSLNWKRFDWSQCDAKETFSTLKSGSDCIIIAQKEGKSTTIVLNVIQRLANRRITKGFDYCWNKAKVLEMESLLKIRKELI
jgi:hypothetical protein